MIIIIIIDYTSEKKKTEDQNHDILENLVYHFF